MPQNHCQIAYGPQLPELPKRPSLARKKRKVENARKQLEQTEESLKNAVKLEQERKEELQAVSAQIASVLSAQQKQENAAADALSQLLTAVESIGAASAVEDQAEAQQLLLTAAEHARGILKPDQADDVMGTQLGAEDPSEHEIERLMRDVPLHLHARLAARLVQPGVEEVAAAATARSPNAGDGAKEREHSGSRSPRRIDPAQLP